MSWFEAENTLSGARAAFRMRGALTTVGRGAGVDVVLEDPTLDEVHLTVVRAGPRWQASAQRRDGAVVVNGQRSRKAYLDVGDALQVGAWRLVLRDGEMPDDRTSSPRSAPSTDADAHALLRALVALSGDMMRAPTLDALFDVLLLGLIQLTGAEKGFILALLDERHEVVAAHGLRGGALDERAISDSIVAQVVETRQPVLVQDALHEDRWSAARSVVDLRLTSVIAAPLVHADRVLGVIYLGNDAVRGQFSERHVDLLRLFAAHASLVLYHALQLHRLRDDHARLQARLDAGERPPAIAGSPAMVAAYRVLRRVAPFDHPVLILGETGTGKELAAREVHAASERAGGPFVAINCGAIPDNLLESELFGHRKGAFTGADADKMGKFEAANGGTLFLDEIAEMPLHLQVKLLRVLQESAIERVGDLAPRPIDVRVVSATHQDLAARIREGRFREDLYYRLAGVEVSLPPLRARGDDLDALADAFLETYRARYGGVARGFTERARRAMRAWPWAGNVRELESRIRKAVVLADGLRIDADDLGLDAQGGG
jgi:transcriptional regulator with GAF, ATPase, and Fis domain